ncbi:MAG: hypothetical protein Q7S34_03380 [bacterium]|nr:hypothetical protein [bacterium]
MDDFCVVIMGSWLIIKRIFDNGNTTQQLKIPETFFREGLREQLKEWVEDLLIQGFVAQSVQVNPTPIDGCGEPIFITIMCDNYCWPLQIKR